MKNLIKIIFLVAFFFGFISMSAQKITAQEIAKPSEGKSLVYILRTGAGILLNFRLYDNDKFLGAISGTKYMVYECEPGEHLFWATSENRDYIEATLEPNSVYVLNAQGQMGAFVAGVDFSPLNPEEFRDKRTFYQVIKGAKKQEYVATDIDKAENILKGLEKYKELKTSNSKKIKILDSTWKFENADKPIKK